MYELINEELNSIIKNYIEELNTNILNYILIKTIIFASEVFEKVVSNIQQGKRGDKNV